MVRSFDHTHINSVMLPAVAEMLMLVRRTVFRIPSPTFSRSLHKGMRRLEFLHFLSYAIEKECVRQVQPVYFFPCISLFSLLELRCITTF